MNQPRPGSGLPAFQPAVAEQKAVLVDVREADEWQKGHVARPEARVRSERGAAATARGNTRPNE